MRTLWIIDSGHPNKYNTYTSQHSHTKHIHHFEGGWMGVRSSRNRQFRLLPTIHFWKSSDVQQINTRNKEKKKKKKKQNDLNVWWWQWKKYESLSRTTSRSRTTVDVIRHFYKTFEVQMIQVWQYITSINTVLSTFVSNSMNASSNFSSTSFCGEIQCQLLLECPFIWKRNLYAVYTWSSDATESLVYIAGT